MCGIAGCVTARAVGVRDRLHAATRTLLHRGPDSAGVHVHEGTSYPTVVGLAATRLAILDLSDAGGQPMVSPDGTTVLVFNGEVYNHDELRTELTALGHRFRSSSDTEVLLAAWSEWGPACLPRLNGMFAFALLDTNERRLYLARDPFGIKPLFLAETSDGWAFGSEVPALFHFQGVKPTLDPVGALLFLERGTTDELDGSTFAGVQQVPAAHSLAIPLDPIGPPVTRRYWQPDPDRECSLAFRPAADRLRDVLTQNVRTHLRSDVPLGFALSGGVDSGAVAASARRLLGADAEIHTFSYIADDPALTEKTWIEANETVVHPVGHRFPIAAAEWRDRFTAVVDAQGEPFADPTVVVHHKLCALAREAGLKVILTGQGADELFAGYHRFLVPAVLSRRPRSPRDRLALLAYILKAPATRRQLFLEASRTWAPRLTARRSRRTARGSLARADWFAERGVRPPPLHHPLTLREHLHLATTAYYLPTLLRYEDRNAMAFSIENRVPFLTTPMAELALSLPEAYLVLPSGERKAVLREAIRDIVPSLVRNRTDKIGFATPWPRWLSESEDWANEKVRHACSLPFLDAAQVKVAWDAVRRGRLARAGRLWRCLAIATWVERFQVGMS